MPIRRRDPSSPTVRRAMRPIPPLAEASPRDVIELLTRDHDELLALLAALMRSEEDEKEFREETLAALRVGLRVHARLEEAIFYPAFAAAARTTEDEVMIEVAELEHQGALEVLDRLDATDVCTIEFRALATVLWRYVSHHAIESGERAVFQRARAILPRSALLSMGDELRLLREVFVAEPIPTPPSVASIRA